MLLPRYYLATPSHITPQDLILEMTAILCLTFLYYMGFLGVGIFDPLFFKGFGLLGSGMEGEFIFYYSICAVVFVSYE